MWTCEDLYYIPTIIHHLQYTKELFRRFVIYLTKKSQIDNDFNGFLNPLGAKIVSVTRLVKLKIPKSFR